MTQVEYQTRLEEFNRKEDMYRDLIAKGDRQLERSLMRVLRGKRALKREFHNSLNH